MNHDFQLITRETETIYLTTALHEEQRSPGRNILPVSLAASSV